MGNWIDDANSRALGRVTGFGIGIAVYAGNPIIALSAVLIDAMWAVIDTVMRKRGWGR